MRERTKMEERTGLKVQVKMERRAERRIAWTGCVARRGRRQMRCA